MIRLCDIGFCEAKIPFVDLSINDGFHEEICGRPKTINLGDVPRDARPALQQLTVEFDLRRVRLGISIDSRPISGERFHLFCTGAAKPAFAAHGLVQAFNADEIRLGDGADDHLRDALTARDGEGGFAVIN